MFGSNKGAMPPPGWNPGAKAGPEIKLPRVSAAGVLTVLVAVNLVGLPLAGIAWAGANAARGVVAILEAGLLVWIGLLTNVALLVHARKAKLLAAILARLEAKP
ncbi:MAG: hypothetical protein H7841_08385 [Magnetospirillum sp. WYHS-4]